MRILPVALLAVALTAFAQAPKRLPPDGVDIPEPDRAELQAGVSGLGRDLRGVTDPLRPDAEVFHKAVDWALRYNEFHDLKQVDVARRLLAEGRRRTVALRAGTADWTSATGRVVRAYVSRLDGSTQPYGLVVPATWKGPSDRRPRPLWIWNHGRNEKLSELAFLDERMNKAPEFAPDDTFVLLPYGRYCNATKFAGEVDVFESLAAVRAAYPIDGNRIVNGGFSMGGGSAWHLAVHHAGLWVASAPGAGFADTAEFTGALIPGKPVPPWHQRVLWRWYDATEAAQNLFNHPVLAYAGDQDKQKMAGDRMAREMAEEGLKLERVLGVATGHKYDPASKEKILTRVGEWVKAGRDPAPREVRFTTHTLRYSRMEWLEVEGLERHWTRADVVARVEGAGVTATTRNVTRLCFIAPPVPAAAAGLQVVLDRQAVTLPAWKTGFHAAKANGKWGPAPVDNGELRKRPGLSGPVDDAFMDSFLFVRPTGKPLHEATGAWVTREMEVKASQWRAIYRGEVRMKNDVDVTDSDLAAHNFVLWGDPSSNALLARLLPKLPLQWDAAKLVLGPHTLSSADHVPVLVYPNPAHPSRYVVLNSGLTFREFGNGSNANQIPMLPDWTLVDIRQPPSDLFPGKLAATGFFDEAWRFTATQPE